MPKKILFESFKNRFLIEANDLTNQYFPKLNNDLISWSEFLFKLDFTYKEKKVLISWNINNNKVHTLSFEVKNIYFYKRGDLLICTSEKKVLRKNDDIKYKNKKQMREIIDKVAKEAGYEKSKIDENHLVESEFHDQWAALESPEKINVKLINEASTSPELRCITKKIGEFKNKKILDVGCGLGESSIYFAMKGADVTALDLSQGMLNKTEELAKINNVKVKTHLATAENFQFNNNEEFDVIYIGNCLHHADVNQTMKNVIKHLKHDGLFVSWDPIAYNPVINIYRFIASKVRTPDEHPLKIKDIKDITKNFKKSSTDYFWLTTLIVFILMIIFQRKNPNKERFWKTVIYESEKWNWLYKPLAKFDYLILKILPPLKLLCWNVVITGSHKKND